MLSDVKENTRGLFFRPTLGVLKVPGFLFLTETVMNLRHSVKDFFRPGPDCTKLSYKKGTIEILYNDKVSLLLDRGLMRP